MTKKALLTLGILLTILQAASLAAVCPDLVKLGDIPGSTGIFNPAKVALDGKGNLYVTDNYNSQVRKYGYGGQLLSTLSIAKPSKPSGIAISSSGKVYIGTSIYSNRDYTGKVSVYDTNFNYISDLGIGAGEFAVPAEIEVDEERIYVADIYAHKVRVYGAADGAFLYEFGGYGIDGGDLAYPIGLGIGSAGDVYVADRALFYDSGSAAYAPGAGAHIWNRNDDGSYTFSTRFGTYSSSGSAGSLYQAGGLAVDSSDRVLITDYVISKIQVFDPSGAAVCALDSVNAPNAIVAGKDKRLVYVASGSVFIYGADDYVKLGVSPSSLAFEAQQCGEQPADQTITISNEGPGVLAWRLSTDSGWITASATTGEINGAASVNVGISVDPSLLALGTNSGTITISTDGAEATVSVSATVAAPPALGIAPGAFSFEVRGNDAPPAESLFLAITGGTASWEASADSTWISVSPSSGSSESAVANVSVNTSALESMDGGQYTGNITVSAGCASGSPAVATVALTYIKGGTIRVTTNVEAAAFTVVGPETYTGSGTSYVVDAVPEGDYTITYGGVAGFKVPVSATLAVFNGEEAEFVGSYKDLRRDNSVIATIGVGEWYVSDEVAAFDEAGTAQGSFVVPTSSAARDGEKPGMSTVAIDVDGDGVEEIITAHDRGVISAYRLDGTAVEGVSFMAFAYSSYVELAAADLDGDGTEELIVSSGTSNGDQAEVRAFGLAGGTVTDTGIYFIAYESRNGVHVAAGDLDGDGAAEIITAPGGSGKVSVDVRIFKVDSSLGAGAWSVADAGGLAVGTSYATDLAAGDLDADDADEIILSTLARSSDKLATVSAYRASDLTRVLGFTVPSTDKGALVAVGDMDMDGQAEIVVGESAHTKSGATVRVYGPDGAQKGEFTAFDGADIHGVRVSLGQVAE